MRIIAQILLLLITIIVFIFALLSGSEGYGGGFMGIVKNSPNSLPWLLLFGLNYLVWKKELLGGIILTVFGVFISWFFNSGEIFNIEVFFLTSFITLIGLFFIYLNLNDRRKKI
jgi:hypothetical protein